MLKLAGIVLFSVCISMCGFFMSIKVSEGTRKRREFIELIHAIKNGIQYGKLSLHEIFSTFSAHELTKCGFMNALIKNSNSDITAVLNSVPLGLSEKEMELMYAFSQECGKSTFSEEEIKNCERYIFMLEALDKELSEQENTKKQIYSKLGILAGILSCILLL